MKKCNKCNRNNLSSVIIHQFDDTVIQEIQCLDCKEKVTLISTKEIDKA